MGLVSRLRFNSSALVLDFLLEEKMRELFDEDGCRRLSLDEGVGRKSKNLAPRLSTRSLQPRGISCVVQAVFRRSFRVR
jgi:hypothetical protein